MGAIKEIATEVAEHGIDQIVVTKSENDGATLIVIDTLESAGRVRIDLNDGTIWDQDPELDVPDMLDGFEVRLWRGDGIVAPALECLTCGQMVGGATMRRTLREHVAAAKQHNESCETGGKQ